MEYTILKLLAYNLKASSGYCKINYSHYESYLAIKF